MISAMRERVQVIAVPLRRPQTTVDYPERAPRSLQEVGISKLVTPRGRFKLRGWVECFASKAKAKNNCQDLPLVGSALSRAFRLRRLRCPYPTQLRSGTGQCLVVLGHVYGNIDF